MQTLSYYLKHKRTVGNIILVYFFRWLPDKVYLKAKFRLIMGEKLNLKSPKSFNEKLQWLKLYNRRPEYTIMVDKVKAKDYVKSIIGEEYIIPSLGVWKDPDEIDFDKLPNSFVLKCNHNSGLGMYICKDKAKMNRKEVINNLRKGINQNYYTATREWPYKNVPRRILAEQYLEPDSETNDLRDYKFFCFNGKVKMFKIDFDRHVDHHANYFDREGTILPFGEQAFAPRPDKKLSIPKTLSKMITLAESIAEGHIFVRVDFYDHNGRIYFGEMTFFPVSGFGKYVPAEWDSILGSWLELPLKSNNNNGI